MSPRIVLPAAVVTALALVAPTDAGPEKITFPAGHRSHVLYATVDRYDIKQHRELYGTPEAVKAAREGRPLPSGSVLTLVQYKAQVDAQGNPLKGPDGRFLKGNLIGYTVMEKRTGWGAEYPPEMRNGEWEYAVFTADQKLNEKANYKACFACHKPHEKQDFVISLARLKGTAPAAAATASGDVKIAGFAFGPNNLAVPVGKTVTWLNTDDSPHQIAVAGLPRSEFLFKGQSHSQAFGAAGVYSYACGLHPGMKGTVEAKER